MKRGARIGAIVCGGIAAGAVLVLAVATLMWDRASARAAAALSTPKAYARDTTVYGPALLDGLPPPVARYFQFALVPGHLLVRRAHIRWTGEFRTQPDAKWSSFTADQQFTTDPPAFLWDAKIHMAPLVTVRVRDQYIGGEGLTLAKLAALIPVANQSGTPEMAAGALGRYLGEAAWFPTSLLPSAHLSWSAIDDSSARATLTDGVTRVSADFRFAPSGEIRQITMERFRDVDGRGVLTPFEGQYTQYRRVNGMMVPGSGEVAWILPGGAFPYWRGRLQSVEYEAFPLHALPRVPLTPLSTRQPD